MFFLASLDRPTITSAFRSEHIFYCLTRKAVLHALIQEVSFFSRCNRSLKSALRAMLNQSNWLENLPLVLCSAIKEGIQCSSAEVIYGTTLRLPGQFFKSSQTTLNITSLVDRLTAKVANLAYNPPALCKKPKFRNYLKHLHIVSYMSVGCS